MSTGPDDGAAGSPPPGLLMPAQEAWTPERIARFHAEFDAALAATHQIRWLPVPRPLMVLHYRWTEGVTERQETYGPWTVLDDESHLAAVRDFIDGWKRLSGCEPTEVTMALLVDPGAWLAERESQQGQDARS